MAGHLTLAILKPAIHRERRVGETLSMIEKAGFSILLCKMLQLLPEGAEELYAEHKGKPEFQGLVSSVVTGPSWILVLSRPNAVEEWQKILELLPAAAKKDLHASAHDWDAKREINFFFNREIRVAEEVDKLKKYSRK
jgi:nucleoside diphosphate kinase